MVKRGVSKFKYLFSLMIVLILLSLSLVSAGLLVSRTYDDLPEGINLDNLCIDTDANKQSPETKRGYVQDINGVYWDECNPDSDGVDLIEMVCKKGFVDQELITCEKGCYLGSCVKYSFFRLPKRVQLPSSQKLFSLQTFTGTQATKKKESSGYSLNLFNLIKLNDIFKDIDRRLKKLEGVPEGAFPLVVRLTAIDEFDHGSTEILKMAYYRVNYDENLFVESESFVDPDLEIFAEEMDFEKLKSISHTGKLLKKELERLYKLNRLKVVALTEKGKLARKEGLEILS